MQNALAGLLLSNDSYWKTGCFKVGIYSVDR